MAERYDVIIVGAGPSGMSAAIYTSREDLKTLILEGGAIGGIIATTDQVDNYPGFPEGVSGMDLSDAMYKQALRFGTEVKLGATVTALKRHDNGITLSTTAGEFEAGSVLIATGSQYRHLDVPGEKELEGSGVHYCATCDGPLYRGAHLLAVGGGNSMLQEGLFLTKFAQKLTILVRGPKFKGSEVLIKQIAEHENVEVLFNSSVAQIEGDGHLFTGVKTLNKATHAEGEVKADGMFIFIGLIPNTDWLEGTVELDDRGFVKIDHAFATNVEGVFAAGDVVVGSVGQVAAGVGEGVSAALSIRQYLDPNHALPTYAAPGA